MSIVVPVYNAEIWLSACLDSIAAQTEPSGWECILVDDGSTDGSGRLCDERAAADSRFRVLHRENGGVSAARNAGIDAARGEYLTFADADDRVSPRLVEYAMADQLAHPDALVVWQYTPEKAVFEGQSGCSVAVFTNRERLRWHQSAQAGTGGVVWNKLFRTAWVRAWGIRFSVGMRYGEDGEFESAYIRRMAQETRLDFPVRVLLGLFYYYNPGNSSSTMKQRRRTGSYFMEQIGLYRKHTAQICSLPGYPQRFEEQDAFTVQAVCSHYFNCLSMGLYKDPKEGFGRQIPPLRKIPEIQQMLHACACHKLYNAYYLPYRLGWKWLIGRMWYSRESERKWLYWKLYWAGYYLLGGNWNR
nr:glycosyltransferase [Gemmiger formicilis]